MGLSISMDSSRTYWSHCNTSTLNHEYHKEVGQKMSDDALEMKRDRVIHASSTVITIKPHQTMSYEVEL